MIIHRAFTREVLQTCGAVSVILLSIFLIARVMGFLRQAVEGDIPAGSVLLLLALKTVAYLDILAPLILYISTLLVLGRWSRDNELTIVGACGIGIAQFLKPALVLFAVVGGMAAVFAWYLSPLSSQAAATITRELRDRAVVSGAPPSIRAGVFTATRDGDGVYFVERRDGDNFAGIFVYDDGGVAPELIVADSARLHTDDTGNEYLLLGDGARYQGAAGDSHYRVLAFETYGLRLQTQASSPRKLSLRARPTTDLLAGDAAAIGEFHWRASKVMMLAVLMIFALAFATPTYRRKRFPALLAALLVYFAYANLLGVGVALIRRGATDPHLTLWVVHFLFLAAAIFLLRRRSSNLPLLPGLSPA